MTTIMRLNPADVAAYYPSRVDFPFCAWALMTDDMQLVMVGGLQWVSGRCYIWMDHTPHQGRKHALALVRIGRHMLKRAEQLGENGVWAIRDDVPTSQRLLSILGFEFHSMEDDKELWLWTQKLSGLS